jgi:hypothetical protein
MPRVFLGGTCHETAWRDWLIPLLKIDYFNPVVDTWDDAARENEEREKAECDYCLFVITPHIGGLFSIAEVVDLSNKVPGRTVFCYLEQDSPTDPARYGRGTARSLPLIGKMVQDNGATWCRDLQEVADFLNQGM